MNLEKLIIGCPFGNYFNLQGFTSTLGTFTLQNRGGNWKRLWRAIRTLRYNRRLQGWTSCLKLPNPGIYYCLYKMDYWDKIISIHGFDEQEWRLLIGSCYSRLGCCTLELNISCPNSTRKTCTRGFNADVLAAIRGWLTPIDVSKPIVFIPKLPPINPLEHALPFYDLGVKYFHACNALPIPNGSLSGKPCKQFGIAGVEALRRRFLSDPDVKIIGGGGVTHFQDVKDYLSAGADHVAVASVLINPFNWSRVKKFPKQAEGDK